MKVIRFVAVLFFSVAVISFSIMNREAVEVHFPFASVDITLFLFFFMVLALGMVVGLLALIPDRMKARKSLRTSKKRISELENELSTLKAREDIAVSLESFADIK